jgi:hypothetical protein
MWKHVGAKVCRRKGFQAEPMASSRPFISRQRSVKAELSLRPTRVPSIPEKKKYVYEKWVQ